MPKVTYLNDYRHLVLTSLAMKCFERPETLDPLQFEDRTNRSKDDGIAIALHTVLSLQDKRNIYMRMLFIDYSSGFNTIVPTKLVTKLRNLGLNTSLCNWIQDFNGPPPRV